MSSSIFKQEASAYVVHDHLNYKCRVQNLLSFNVILFNRIMYTHRQPGEAGRLVAEKSATHEKIALSKITEDKERKEREQKAREERRRKKEEEERRKEEEQPKIQEITDEEAERLQKEIDEKKVRTVQSHPKNR